MTKTDIWMPFYGAEYHADTPHLTTLQHGAYLLLLWAHWRLGDLPDDDAQLATITKLRMEQWRKISPVLREFFDHKHGRLTQRRLVKELEKAGSNTAKKRAAGKASAEVRQVKRAAQTAESTIDAATDVATDAQQNARPLPLPSPLPYCSLSKTESPNNTYDETALIAPAARKRARVSDDDPAFIRFWDAYPRKVGKGAARKAWATAITRASPDAIISAVQAQRFDPREQYQPHPATWLNREQWGDEAATGDPVLRAVGLLPDGTLPPSTPDWSLLK